MNRSSIASFASAVVLLAPLACSSADFETATDSGAPGDSGATGDGTGNDTSGGGDTTPGCIVPPTKTGGETDFCNAVADVYSRCGECEDCRQTNVNNCIEFGDSISDLFKNAFIACKDEVKCGDFGDFAGDPCIKGKLAAGPLDPKQLAAKDAYCKACPSNAFECDHFFSLGGPDSDAGPDAGVSTIGAFVYYGNDTAVQAMIDGCSGGVNCNPYLYVICTSGKFCGPIPTDACGSKFCSK